MVTTTTTTTTKITTKLAMATMCKMSAVKHRTRNLRPRYLNSRNTEMA